ncbi:hypothetical protein TWF696_002476 [Orbilia brochopaga]|uniref:BTB domain-containing protein n=1 Tax=Orbilia brochopaga TaxID=3140254 RepID=A0AAV9U296_9PEZI
MHLLRSQPSPHPPPLTAPPTNPLSTRSIVVRYTAAMPESSSADAPSVVQLTLQDRPDLAIKSQDRLFKVHQDQLMGKGTLLNNIQYNGIHDGMPQIETKDIRPDVLSCVLDFLYTGDFDEAGKNQYVPSSVLIVQTDDEALKSPPGSPSTERHKRLAAVYTVAQKYKIANLKELVEEKFASSGRISTYLDGIIADGKLGPSGMGAKLQAKLEEAAVKSKVSSSPATPANQLGEDSESTATGVTTPASPLGAPSELESTNSQIQPASQNPAGGLDTANIKTSVANLKAHIATLDSTIESLRSSSEEGETQLKELSNKLKVVQQEKFQAELCHHTAQSRLEGLIKTLNETQRCGNGGCRASLNILVHESEVRTKGNVIIRCGICNARQR